MDITYVKGENFLSYQSLEHTFTPTSFLIQGINKTDEDQESNGTGKTGFQSLIEYCLYGNTSQKIRDKELIRFGQREAILELRMYCAVRQEELIIQRIIKKHGASKITLAINNTLLSIATVLDGNNFINDWIGISKEDLQSYYIINKARYKSFFNTSNTEKIQIISRFSNAHLIDNVFAKINEKLSAQETGLQVQNLQKARAEGAIEVMESQLAEGNDDKFEDQKVIRLKQIDDQIESTNIKIVIHQDGINDCHSRLKQGDEDIDKYHQKINETYETLSTLDTDQYEKLLQENKQLVNTLNQKWQDVNDLKQGKLNDYEELSQILSKVNKNLMGIVACPKCHFKFPAANPDIDVEKEKLKHEKIDGVLKSVKKRILYYSEKMAIVNQEKASSMQDETKYRKMRDRVSDRINDVKKTISSFELSVKSIIASRDLELSKIQNANNAIADYRIRLSELKKKAEHVKESKFDGSKNLVLEKKLTDSKAELGKYDLKIKEAEEEIYKTNQWSFNFKSFKGFLANQFLQVIEGLSNKNLASLKSDLQIKWEGYKMKSDGTMSDKITAYIVRGGEIRDFNSFSCGERARMELALVFTIRELINNSHPYGGLNFLFTDEIFEGLDGLGLSNFMKAISDFNYPILITTHITDFNICSNVLTVIKKHNISKLYE